MITAAELRSLALSLPEAEERETWGEATFRVRGKIFLMMGPDGSEASVKATLGDQAALLAARPDTFSPSPYTGRFGWVTARLDVVEPEMLAELVSDAWRRTAPKALVKQFDASSASTNENCETQ